MRGYGGRFPAKSFLVFLVCLVALCTGMAGAEDRFTNNGDGTVTDTRTGLMWAQTDNMGNINWQNAKLYCENIILGGYDGWRMPTIEELETLFSSDIDRHETICGKKTRSVPGIELSCGFVWSSQVRSVSERYPISAMAYDFAGGYQYSARKTQYRGYRALPVRTVLGQN